MNTIERWSMFEISAPGKTEGNPFTDYTVTATFVGKSESVTVDGFYDGDGVYKARFMPSFDGEYRYTMSGSFGDTIEGSFTVVPPSAGNHGPVRVANQYHFVYEDTTPYYSVGTTCYAWAHQPEETHRKTLAELDKGYFNKMRFCVFPKHYIHNFRNPETFPYVGTPVDNSGLNEETFSMFVTDFSGNDWDFTRFNPEHFRRIERCIVELMERGIEADIIVMHPYDRWGFSAMSPEQDDLYLKYVIARFAAYRNVWWSLANEYDLLRAKKLSDWERYARIICEKDPYNHLRGIHNCMAFYDHSRPWITHCSLQRQDLYRHVEYTDDYRERWGKPVVWDEISYEGNIDMGWGNISGQELVRRFWEAAMRGGYAGHGETFVDNENDILWWSHGGELHGESPARIRFLHEIMTQTPGLGLRRGQGSFDETVGVPDGFPAAGGGYEIHYYGFGRPSFRDFRKPEGQWKVEIIDTWEMTITDAGVHSGKFRVALPGKEYMAVRLVRV